MSDILTSSLQGGIGSAFDRVHKRVLIAEWAGRLLAVHLDGTVKVLGEGYTDLEDVVVSADGSRALLTERGGALLQVDLDRAHRRQATVIASRLSAPHQIVWLERHAIACVVEHGRLGRLVAVWLATGRVRVLADGFNRAVGLALDRRLQTAYVSEQGAGRGHVTAVDIRGRRRRTVAAGLVNPFMLTWADDTQSALLVAERDPANRLTRIELRSGRRHILLDGLDPRPSSAAVLDPNRVVVVADRTVVVHDLTPVPSLRVELDVGSDPLFLGAYRRIPVTIVGSGVSFDDLEFDVVEGPRGGRVSYSRDETFSAASPEIMLLGGYRAGTYTLRARRAATGDVLGTASFEITDLWTGEDGPSLWFEGISQPAVSGSAWGGGSAGPQNVDVVPASGTRNVAVLLVDTATQRYPSDSSAFVQEWEDEVLNGVASGGVTRSCNLYFQEISQGTFQLSLLGVFGPVQLSGDFEDYFTLTDSGLWKWRSGFFQSAVTAGDDLIDYSNVDSLVVVVRSAAAVDPSDPDPALNMPRFAWPWAWGNMFTTDDGSQSFKVVVMPHDWGDSSDREIYDTLSHELGHNLDLPDLYMDTDAFGSAIASRDVDTWDIMSWDDPLPHMTAPNKMRLGWIRAGWVKAYDFQSSGAVDETVTLYASELGEPPSGQFSAVEVRLADGWNYYFEYRSEQAGQLGDQALAPDRRVIGTDVVSPHYTAPVVRRDIILLPEDADGDGPILGTGQDYEELDVSDPMFPTDFSVEVLSTDSDSADIRIRYGVNSKPDPSIRPWPGSGTNAWQSPDIEVRNDKNAADPELANLPWTGHPNTIVAKVKNVGSLLAEGVRVNFSVKDFTAGGGAETPLGFDIQDIPMGSTVEFALDGWVPPSGGHYCVVARIPLHVQPGPPTIVEMTELNNLAQSNYTEFISAESSPPVRQRGWITVGNPYSERTRVHLHPRQTNPFFRTYLGHTTVELDAGEERQVEFMVEALHGTPDVDWVLENAPQLDEWLRRPNHVNVAGFIEDPHDRQLHSVHGMGGVVARVRTGKATTVNAGTDNDTVFGRVVDADGKDVASGQVIVAIREPGRPETERTAIADVSEGRFHATFDEEIQSTNLEGTAEYLGDGQWAPSPEFRFRT